MMNNSRTAHNMNSSPLRLFIAIPLGLITSIALFAFMSWMVGSVKTGVMDDQSPLAFDVVMQEQDSASQRRLRQLPEPPKVPEQPQALSTPATPMASVPSVQTPQVSLDANMAFSDVGVAINMPSINVNNQVSTGNISQGIGQQQQAMPLYRAQPAYPPRMLKRRVEGYVVMSFTINEQGRPEDIQVVEAKPSKAFVRPAVQALRNWKYQPQIEGGKAVKQAGQQVKIEFKINQ